jgi:stage IV sporulation protein FB
VFILFAAAAVASGEHIWFLMAFGAVTLHEMAHIAVAFKCGLRVERLSITPLGEQARIVDMESLTQGPRIAIALAGPAMSLALALCFRKASPDFATANLAVLLLNIMPAYPLDGGRVIHIILGNSLGILRANRIAKTLSKVTSALMFTAGLAVTILFPYNISLVLVAAYLWRNMDIERVRMMCDFFRFFDGRRFGKRKAVRARFYVVEPETEIICALERLCWDTYGIFAVKSGDSLGDSIDESAVFAGFLEKSGGDMGTLAEERRKKSETACENETACESETINKH